MAKLISDARVAEPPSDSQSFFSSRSIFPILTGRPAARFAERGWWLGLVPRIFDQVYELPCLLDFIAAREERGVAAHRVKQEALVGFGARFAKTRAVVEIHLHRLDAECGAGDFCLHSE